MNTIRWIFSAPISLVILFFGTPIVGWGLGWIWKIGSLIMVSGTRYDVPTIFDFEKDIQDFKTFLFVTCLSTLITAAISGYIGGKMCPNNHPKVKGWLFAILVLPLLIFSSIFFWDSTHWFYSILWIIDMALVGIIFVALATTNEEE